MTLHKVQILHYLDKNVINTFTSLHSESKPVSLLIMCTVCSKQEAQLSQRDRATLRVI